MQYAMDFAGLKNFWSAKEKVELLQKEVLALKKRDESLCLKMDVSGN